MVRNLEGPHITLVKIRRLYWFKHPGTCLYKNNTVENAIKMLRSKKDANIYTGLSTHKVTNNNFGWEKKKH